VRYYLGAGIDPEFQHPEYFTAPLFEAINSKGTRGEIVHILLEEGNADASLQEDLTGLTHSCGIGT
jgi:hypothetical protein